MTSLVPQSFIPGYRLQSGTDLNEALANPQWSTSMTFEATTGGTAATSAKIVNTITNITSATAGAGVTVPRSAIGKYLYIINSSPNTVFVYAEGDATINGNSSYSLATGQSITLYGVDTTSWEVTSGSASVNVDDFGAKGDAQFRIEANIGYVTIAAGSRTFTYSASVFTPADVGKMICIESAGTAGGYFTTTIAAYVSPTVLTLTDPAITTVNNALKQIMWAFDDTAAFNAAIASTDGEILLNPNKIYAVNLNLTKRSTILNGQVGAFNHFGALPNYRVLDNVYSLIPFDRTKPVIQIGDDTQYVGGITIQNMTIYNPLSNESAPLAGNIGIYVGPGAYGNRYQNLSIDNFNDYCVKMQGGNAPLITNADTIAATNGSPNITGTSTTWSSSGVVAGDKIVINSVIYTVSSVTSNTAIVLTANYGGTSGSGISYSIYRVSTLGTYHNWFSQCQFGVQSSAVNCNALLGMFVGTSGYAVTTTYFTQMIFRPPSPGKGLTFWIKGCEPLLSQCWVQWSYNNGAKFESDTFWTGAISNGSMICSQVQFEGVTPTAGQITVESTYDTTGTIPPIYGLFSITGKYKNASAQEYTIWNNNGLLTDKITQINPQISGNLYFASRLTPGTLTGTLMNVGTDDTLFVGNTGKPAKLQGSSVFLRPEGVDMFSASWGSRYIRPGFYDGQITNGTSTHRWADTYSINFRAGVGTALWTSGDGDPNDTATITASVLVNALNELVVSAVGSGTIQIGATVTGGVAGGTKILSFVAGTGPVPPGNTPGSTGTYIITPQAAAVGSTSMTTGFPAPVGSLFTRTDGGANTTLYVKESGASYTGWVAK